MLVTMIETTQMYEGAPWCLGKYSSFEVDKPQLITLLGYDYVIWKDESGKLNAIDNICPHAGANLAKGGYVINIQGENCLACPYHGNKVQFLGDGRIIVDNNVSNRAIQAVLPLQVIDGLVWTYGLNWRYAASSLGQEQDGKLVAKPIEPKLPIPNYNNIPFLPKSNSQLHLSELHHIYSRSGTINNSIDAIVWNVHDAEHFAGTHRNSMLAKEVKIDNFTQDDCHFSWQLVTNKRDDRDAKRNKMSLLIDKEVIQSFNTFLPGLTLVTTDFKGQFLVVVLYVYPESTTTTRFNADAYLYSKFTWWQKLFQIPKIGNKIRDRLLLEDMSIVDNLYSNFQKKITLKNDVIPQLAMDYLKNWS